MSAGPILMKELKFKKYYHLRLTKKDWCTYSGNCPTEENLVDDSYCWLCKYAKKLDLPKLLLERGICEKNNFDTTISDSDEIPRVVVLEARG